MGKIYEYKVLRVDLTNEEIKTEKIVGDDVKNYLGGRGLASKILYDEIDPKVDPLSPENKLIYATGLLTGTAASTGGRYMVVTKGPLTGTIASSNSGGFFGAELRFSGNDIIIFEGKAKRPLYLSIKGEEVELKDASNLWGKTVYETTDLLIEEAGDKNARVSCIGPAGENLVKFAAIMNEKDRAAGRTGVGAVMGSKNLKAVVVKADEKQVEYFKDEMMKVVRKQTKMLKEDGVTGEGLPALGTKVLDNIINSTGLYPVNNFQDGGTFADVDEVSGEALVEKGYLQSNKGCYGCPIRCARDTKLPNGQQGEGPEYESGWAFGADCGVNDLNAITEANFLCNDLGMDTITAGTTIACAMELYEKGYIDKDELENGPELKFGSSESIIYYTEKMAYRKGLGDKLAEGSYRLADSKGQPELSMSVKKQELPAYDPRGVQGQGLNYVTSNRGGCHVRGYMISPEVLGAPEKLDPQELEGKAGWVKTFQDLTAVIDSVGMCLFTSFALGLDDYREIVNAGTQFDYTSDSLLETGERIYNLERQFNMEAGITPAEDTLPPRFDEPLPDGPQKGMKAEYKKILPEYYEVRGWQEDGWISEQKLKDMKIK
ncbi:aldehyde:ferredoxin oxidoreductase [Halanaerobium congolense]|jgi:aldehyde:ferredoxin oxidoreductase|uniref:Aldehyde:ferredoxin oxidoreductase n=2 Tax=Halanaerobium congolense TaxID=54121 RepID=A0A1I0D6B2_9FIRM|nr:aldehyde ferredoxin oxidoreductase family protein [Halanaerobium congolense]PTX16600.1 aldehyde:ferredoxin oxidoreductase [Halanaerobium congolense]PTX16605.1 aldehyde:ferredoxin oxidoreductase [Halanaerobium congolense]SDG23411.1 aldehyde:ferredoxin oxidoreductase [Halanaerobium congolense]SET27759.1 aldehyde:ferredoxin oxidoreductase [Halanaerobium congolense]SFP80065.1 aldehyde:ferredoxin oxidoreductase [Halanaerobium congolense]